MESDIMVYMDSCCGGLGILDFYLERVFCEPTSFSFFLESSFFPPRFLPPSEEVKISNFDSVTSISSCILLI